MRFAIAVAVLFVLVAPAAAHAAAARAKLDLYTIGPGDDLFERFGHAALCVVPVDGRKGRGPANDTALRKRARCYNYGTTDFGSPPEELGYRFLRGNARFWVSVWSLGRMLDAYRAADRSIYRQRLPLGDAAGARAVAELEHDARPENREYVYHHLRDNCSTRLRDLLDRTMGGALARAGREPLGETYRDLADGALAAEPLLVMLGDVAVGRGIDEPVTRFEAAFLPEYLRSLVRDALGAEPELVYRRHGRALGGKAPDVAHRFAVLGVLLAIVYVAASHFGRERLGAAVVGGFCGLCGLALFTLAGISTVPELRVNEMLLVFLPSDIALPFLRVGRRGVYLKVRLAELVVLLVLAALGVLRQPLRAVVLIPILSMLAMLLMERRRAVKAAPSAPSESRDG